MLHFIFLSQNKIKGDDDVPDNEIDTEIELEARKWRYRRGIAFAAFNFVVFLTLLILGIVIMCSDAVVSKLDKISELIMFVMGGLFTLIAGYMGLSAASDIFKTKYTTMGQTTGKSPDSPG